MRRKFLCGLAAFGWASGLSAQSVPARDLWEFPLGAVLEPAALASEPGGGLWNPASIHLAKTERWRVGVASLAPTSDQGVEGRLLSVNVRRPGGTTIGFSVAQTSVASIVRTETDPQALGDVPYSSLLLSLSAARDLLPHVTVGAAFRYREGRADQRTDNALAADLGVLVHSLPVRDARIALSSFLWRPGREIDDRPAVVMAADARVMGEAGRETRVGYSYNAVNRGAKEHGPYVAWRFDRVDLRGAYLRTIASGRSVSRIRSGVALHYARYVVGVAREEGTTGLGPLYQFTLSSLLR
ncbi:MAG: hypothetical protein IPP90_17590 [Gemmatimonadaceae bacterium]|nr:hypothetical protein [Gemmatimonadaceae bacterium]